MIVTVSIRQEDQEQRSVSASVPVTGIYGDFVLAIAEAGDDAIDAAQKKGWL